MCIRDRYKTKTVVNMLTAIGADKKALIVTPAVDAKLVKSAANKMCIRDRWRRLRIHAKPDRACVLSGKHRPGAD